MDIATHVVEHALVASPIGVITLVSADGSLSGLYMEDHRRRPQQAAFGSRNDQALPEVQRQLAQYFAGERTQFSLDLAPSGTAFQLEVWNALRDVPFGTTVSYGALASAIGRPGAARAVGAANGANPISIVVPCHRVIGAAGALTGYGGGMERKRALLELEGRSAAPGLF
jgi:methylated-DNA-[protein]-cysteine S-methyltransferase